MKRHGYLEKPLRKIAEAIEEAIDCTACASCCRKSTVRLKERDVQRLAKALRIKPSKFLRDYTTPTEDEGPILKRDDATGCTFLGADKLCMIYDDRPDACRDYPNLVHGPGSLVSRMWVMPERAAICPIVYHSMEAFKDELDFERR